MIYVNNMPNTEWYEKKPYMEEIDLYRSDDTSCQIYDMPKILAHHRELIVKEIRVEIEKMKKEYSLERENISSPNIGFVIRERRFVLTDVLELPCLKENE